MAQQPLYSASHHAIASNASAIAIPWVTLQAGVPVPSRVKNAVVTLQENTCQDLTR